MLTHTLIHILEFALFVLFVLLCVQVYRGYRKQAQQVQQQATERAAAAAAQISARARESILGQRATTPVPQMVRIRVQVEHVSAPTVSAPTVSAPNKVVPQEKSSTEKGRIDKPRLIKESVAMSDPVLASSRDVNPALKRHSTQAFAKLNAANGLSASPIKVSEILLSNYIGELFAEPARAADIMPFRTVGSDSAGVAVRSVVAETVNTGVEVYAAEAAPKSRPKELDDNQIITVNNESNAGAPPDRVMCDKVVHAMLDEAKLVCAS